jgi:hypothetical protein
MKAITIGERTFEYQTAWISYGDVAGDEPVTIFYSGTKLVTKKKWWLFGPSIQTEVPKEVFRIYADSDDKELSKSWWRKRIEGEIDLLNRKEELEKGELI